MYLIIWLLQGFLFLTLLVACMAAPAPQFDLLAVASEALPSIKIPRITGLYETPREFIPQQSLQPQTDPFKPILVAPVAPIVPVAPAVPVSPVVPETPVKPNIPDGLEQIDLRSSPSEENQIRLDDSENEISTGQSVFLERKPSNSVAASVRKPTGLYELPSESSVNVPSGLYETPRAVQEEQTKIETQNSITSIILKDLDDDLPRLSNTIAGNFQSPAVPSGLYETPSESIQEPVGLYETPSESVQDPAVLIPAQEEVIAEPQQVFETIQVVSS